MHRIVIVGGGAGGLALATQLGKKLGKKMKECAAAIEQLQMWADRIGVPLVKHKAGSDPAAATSG